MIFMSAVPSRSPLRRIMKQMRGGASASSPLPFWGEGWERGLSHSPPPTPSPEGEGEDGLRRKPGYDTANGEMNDGETGRENRCEHGGDGAGGLGRSSGGHRVR